MSEFLQRAVEFAQEIQQRKIMTNPIVVAGLADTVKNAIAGMARAKASADALGASSQRLVGNVAQVESLKTQLDDANVQLEGAIAAVGGPLESSSSSGDGSSTPDTGSVVSTQADTSSKGAPTTESAPASLPPAPQLGVTQVVASGSVAHSLSGSPEQGIRASLVEVQAANK